MTNTGTFASTFMTNISLMLTLMYAASLVYKHALYRLSGAAKEALFVLLAIGAGWATMLYGFRFSGTVIFDLRFMAVIVAPLFVRRPMSIALIGAGVGLARLSFGLNHASVVGGANVFVMSLLCVAVIRWAERRQLRFYPKMTAVILTVNVMNVLFIAAFGVIPARSYLTQMAPASFFLSAGLGFLFVFILRDFVIEANRRRELERSNARLIEEHRLSEEKSAQLQRAAAALEEKTEQIMQASRYKSEFLANMSHELRTPLNAMLTLSQLLEENSESRLSPEEVRYASLIHSSGRELLGMINDVLDMSKIEAGRMEVFETAFAIAELLEQMDGTFRPMAERKGLGFRAERDPALPEAMTADVQRLQQILRNMLGNAVKFTDAGEIRLSVRREAPPCGAGRPASAAGTVADAGADVFPPGGPASGDGSGGRGGHGDRSGDDGRGGRGDRSGDGSRDGSGHDGNRDGNGGPDRQPPDWVAFTVADTGIGIPEEGQPRIFEAFYQADGATSRHYGGTGLGLSISRQFAELMGGTITVDSTEGKGSRFTLYLPLK